MQNYIHILLVHFLCNIWNLSIVSCELPSVRHLKGADQKHYTLPPCKSCTVLVESFKEGIERTARGKHGGGDAAWEEEKLKSYAKSELRLTEIQEDLCKGSKYSTQCHSLAEQVEEIIENWWFHKQDLQDLHDALCIQELAVCCPPNTFGPKCDVCTDCNGNGKCKGNGTRRGNGKCACAEGYAGENCNVCAQGYYESFRDENKVLCSLCHVSCEAEHGCTTSGPRGCRVCSKGWVMEPERGGCVDADECAAPVRPCSSNQFCVNNEGSHSCLECDRACNGCDGDGPDLCLSCAEGYALRDGFCMDNSKENHQTLLSIARYITYFGLCIATCVLFQSSTRIAAIIGLLVALYITVSEYWLETYLKDDSPSFK